MLSSFAENSTVAAAKPEQQVVEGGFLTGRNPFVFSPSAPLPTFIIQLVVIVCMSRLVKLLLSPFRQPAVIAEILSGILLGPTVLGAIPWFTSTLFPASSLPFLALMSNFGLVLFLFLVGLELDPGTLRRSIQKSFAISLAGMALPFFLGCGASYVLYTYIEPHSSPSQKGFLSYLLFVGVAMSITAFPVLARILTELNLLKTRAGGITIAAAALDDATSWCLLALVISLINAHSALTALYVFLLGVAYTLLLMLVVRPIFLACLRLGGVFAQETPSPTAMFSALMLAFISAFITDAIGIHAIFGGFIAGVIMPHERGFAYHLTEKLEDVVQILFLPLYFALSGLKTQVGTLTTPGEWGVVLLVIVVACAGKILGCTLAARGTKLGWRESFTVGALMNCKGLVELIVLNLGYDAGVIGDKTFAIMVLMALVTTFITVPLVRVLYPPRLQVPLKEEKEPQKTPCLLVSVNRLEQVGPLLSVLSLLQQKMNHVAEMEHRKDSGGSHRSLGDLLNFGGGSSKRTAGGGGGSVRIKVVRLVELTERDSSVMLSASQTALTNDPITKLVKTFCEVTNKQNQVEGVIKVVSMSLFGRALAQVADEHKAKYVLLPWSGSASLAEENLAKAPRPMSVIGGARRRHSVHTAQQHGNFFLDLLTELDGSSTLLIFVDRGGPLVRGQGITGCEVNAHKKQIFLPFFGGRDDRAALDLVMGLSGARNWKVNVVRFREGGRTAEGREVERGVGEQEDEQALQFWFAEGSALGSKRLFGGGALLDQRDVDMLEGVDELEEEGQGSNVQYSELESPNPVGKALQYLLHLGGQDLVVVGRGNLTLSENLGIHYRNEDGERRRVLGDLAEAVMLCHCTASLLVVHEPEKKTEP